jgi:hypothetical protein
MNFILYSSDLFNWNRVELPFVNNSKSTYINLTSNDPSNYVNIASQVFYIYGNFVIIINYTGGPYANQRYIYNSTDCINWNINTTPLPNIFYNIQYILNGQLFAIIFNKPNSYIVY